MALSISSLGTSLLPSGSIAFLDITAYKPGELKIVRRIRNVLQEDSSSNSRLHILIIGEDTPPMNALHLTSQDQFDDSTQTSANAATGKVQCHHDCVCQQKQQQQWKRSSTLSLPTNLM